MRTRPASTQSSRRSTARATCSSSPSNVRRSSARANVYVAMVTAPMPTAQPHTSHSTSLARIDFTASTSIDLRHAIADAAQVADQLRGELAPEVVQMHFDAVRLDFLAPAVHRFLELLARHHRAGLLQQRLEHG